MGEGREEAGGRGRTLQGHRQTTGAQRQGGRFPGGWDHHLTRWGHHQYPNKIRIRTSDFHLKIFTNNFQTIKIKSMALECEMEKIPRAGKYRGGTEPFPSTQDSHLYL